MAEKKSKKEKKLYDTIRRDLLPVIRDSALKRTATTMQEKVDVFDRLRAAMRITLPENKQGLNDNGELCDMKTIEKEVTKFMRQLLPAISRNILLIKASKLD